MEIPVNIRADPKPARFELETVADLDHLDQINVFIEQTLGAMGITGENFGHICVSLDEAVTNVIMYAYPQEKGNVRICIEKRDGRVTFEISDSGKPFNPLEQPVPDVSANIENRMIGGLGIHLIRHMMDEISYRRDNGRNYFILVKKIPGGVK